MILASTRTSAIIAAPAQAIYDAFMDPASLVEWLPPGDMTGVVHSFDAQVGGGYRMSLFYPSDDQAVHGKTAGREDQVVARFLDLAAPRRIVEAVTFVTEDSNLKGEMTLTVSLKVAEGGTEVTMLFENLPPGLRPEDNDEGARLSLEQLARYVNS
jgi:uncharacterized protein YndB with AHSA1/START domain